MDDIKNFLIKHHGNRLNEVIKNNLQGKIIELTSFLNKEDPNMSRRFWHIINDCYEIPKCKVCNINPAKWRQRDFNYVSCSDECKRILISSSVKEKAKLLKPIPTRCNQEQFEKIKTIIKNNNSNKAISLIKREGLSDQLYWLASYFCNLSLSRVLDFIKNDIIVMNNGEIISKEQFLSNIIVHFKTNSIKTIRSIGMYDDLVNLTSFLDNVYSNVTTSQRFWHIQNRFLHIKKCSCCNEKPAKYAIGKTDYIYCSKECSDKMRKITLLKKYGVDNYSKTEAHKKNSANRVEFLFKMTEKAKEQNKLLLVNQLPQDYELLAYDHTCKLLHKNCNKEFEINRSTLQYRINVYKTELCTHCNPIHFTGSSYGEQEVYNFLKSIYNGEIIQHKTFNFNKDQRKYIEVDIYLPEFKLAIEYNGLHWHSKKYKPNNYHKLKSDYCRSIGVHLIHIFEDTWKDKRLILEDIIKRFLNIKNKVIYARNCDFRVITKEDAKLFLNNNHLQGYYPFNYSYGLYYNEELVQLLTFTNKNLSIGEIELSRMCTKCGMSVIGGVEKLLKNSLVELNGKFKILSTFNDNSVFSGEIYEKLGFIKEKILPPDYMYTDGIIRINKRNFRKGRMFNKERLPEKEASEKMGFYKVYDAGKTKYILLAS